MNTMLTGELRMQDYCAVLLRTLQERAELSGLDTAKTEALLDWASTEMANHSQNISRLRQTLMSGLKDFDWIMNDPPMRDSILCAFLLAQPNIGRAVVITKPGKPLQVKAWNRR